MLGRSLGNYGVVSKLGEGGMGVVYLAQHVTLGKKAAIKVLRPALSSNQDVVSRFFNEARAVTAVRNPGIVDVYDFGFLEDRTAYIIMEYLEGESLAARLRRSRPAIPWTLTVVRAITRALQAAHEHGIVHRDLKPDNVFLVPDADLPGGERVKLLDFGIAKLAHGVGDASHTTTGTVMGTPTYMAPEQCRGAGAVDHRADLYSLGCVAYEMLCGQPPFVADGPGDVIARHLYFEPQPPRSRRTEIPAELEEIVLRLLKKDPRARYATAAELVRAIDHLSGASSPGATPIKPLATEFVATLPVVRDTTLNGAASSSLSHEKDARSRRLGIITAAVTVAIGAFVVVWAVTRGGHAMDAAPSVAAALATEPGRPAAAVPVPAAPGPAAPTPSTAPAPAPAAPPTPEAPPIDQAQGASTSPAAGAIGDAASQRGSAPRPAPQPHDAKPDEPSGDASGHPATSIETKTDGVETTAQAVPQSDVTKRDPSRPHDVVRAGPTKRPVAPKKRPEITSGAGTAATEASKPGDALPPAGATPGAGKSPDATPDPPDTGCAPAAFESVLDAKAPSKKVVQEARSRLARCRPSMDPGVYDDIHRRLIGRY